MRRLTVPEIERFATRKGVRRLAVENFLMTCHYSKNSHDAYENARADARSYKWDSNTLAAVIDGIALASGRIR